MKSAYSLTPTASHFDHQRRFIDVLRTRLLVTAVLFLLGFGAVGFRLVDIVCLRGGTEAYAPETRLPSGLKMGRADILDQQGEVLATSVVTSSAYADARVVLNPNEAAKSLAKLLKNMKETELLNRLTSGKSFVWIARHLTPYQKAKIIELGIPGINFTRDQRRVYPHGALAAHVLGGTDIDGNGIAGLERGLDEMLRRDGQPVHTSLDIRIQHLLREELSNGIKEFQARGGNGVVLDVKTGEILAMVSLPDYDPHHPNLKDTKSMFNRNVSGTYEMGSIMKIPNTAMALDSGKIKVTSEYDVAHPIRIGRFAIKDYQPYNGWMTVREIFVRSSNIGAAKMALALGGAHQRDFLEKLGFFTPVKLEIPETGVPIYPKRWRDSTVITTSYGYGVALTVIQYLRGLSGILNDGILHEPTLLKCTAENAEGRRVVSQKTSAEMRELMRLVVKAGTGRKAEVPGFFVGGKSGTVNLRKASGQGYQTRDVSTSFVAYFPKKPRYLVYVMLDSPARLQKTFGLNAAGWNAAEVMGRVIRRMAPLVGLIPKVERDANPGRQV